MGWIDWQLDYLYLLQNFRDISGHAFDNLFINVTKFGEITILLLFTTLIYWCVNKRAGLYLLWNYLFGFIVNLFLKTTACIYRPWLLDTRIKPLTDAIPAATGYSFPSGHTAGAMGVWGAMAAYFWKNKFIRYSCISIVLLVMFSRNYVGVHTPQDVIVSFLIGIFILFVTQKLLNWENKTKNADLIICSVITIICIILTLYVNLKTYPTSCFGSTAYFDTAHIKISTFGRVGFVLGIFYGWFLEKRFVRFEPNQYSFVQKILLYLIGIGVLSALFAYGKLLFVAIMPEKAGLFLINLIVGLFITLFYPFVIKNTCKKKISELK